MSAPEVAVLTVTYNSADDLPLWLGALEASRWVPKEVVVVDCASTDGSAEVARRLATTTRLPVTVVALEENLGFAGGMNRAIAASQAPYCLLLNTDAWPGPAFLERLVGALESEPRAGAATGRLVRTERNAAGAVVLDACGMELHPAWRHLDRGSGEVDHGQLEQAERVFGGTGAALLLRRTAALDVALDGQVFDPAFHSFREDAELAFRFAERGWWVLYEPSAVCRHRRFNLPSRRRAMPAEVNFHSLKNRYLLRAYHQTVLNLLLTLPWTLPRDLGAFLYVLARERSSLGAYGWLWRHRHEILERARRLRARRLADGWALEGWFWRRGKGL